MTPEELRTQLEARGVHVPPSGLLRAAQVARILDKSPGTLQNWRRAGQQPAAVRIGGQWHYSLESLACWMSGTT
jgi:Helix-turn-helix domain